MSKITSVKVKGDNGYTEIPIGLNTTIISENTDLNDITDVGWYRATSTTAVTLSNCPISTAFYMEVKQTRAAGIYQHIVTYSRTNSRHYQRNFNEGWGNWWEWKLTDTTYSNATDTNAGLMSAADKTKLDGVAAGAEVNVQANWNETNTTADSYILNKPFDSITKTVSTSGIIKATPDASNGKLVKCIITKEPSLMYASSFEFYTQLYDVPYGTSGATLIEKTRWSFVYETRLYGGTVDLKTGLITSAWAAVDTGSLNWFLSSYSGDGQIFVTGALNNRLWSTTANDAVVMLNGYDFFKNGSSSQAANMPDLSILCRTNHNNVYVRDDRYSTADDFKEAMSGKNIVYALAEPTIIQKTPLDVRLYKGNNGAIDVTVGIDSGIEIEYITEPFQPLIDILS